MDITDYIFYQFINSAFVQNGGIFYTILALSVGYFVKNNISSVFFKIFKNFNAYY